MEITFSQDVQTNLHIQLNAFSEYKNAPIPSSALDETVEQIELELINGASILMATNNKQPIATARFQLKESALYFYRLSVLPEQQGKGVAKQLIVFLENYAKEQNLTEVQCKVRYNVPRNLHLYVSLGFEIIDTYDVVKPDGATIKTVTMSKSI